MIKIGNKITIKKDLQSVNECTSLQIFKQFSITTLL